MISLEEAPEKISHQILLKLNLQKIKHPEKKSQNGCAYRTTKINHVFLSSI